MSYRRPRKWAKYPRVFQHPRGCRWAPAVVDWARVKGGLACREAPRTLFPTTQSGAISFSGEDEGTARIGEGPARAGGGREGGNGEGSGTAVGGKERAREEAIF